MDGMCLMHGNKQQTHEGQLRGGVTTLKLPVCSRRAVASSVVKPRDGSTWRRCNKSCWDGLRFMAAHLLLTLATTCVRIDTALKKSMLIPLL
jgi:hypothetical protein